MFSYFVFVCVFIFMFAEDVFVVIVAQSHNKAIQLHVSYQESPQSASLVTGMFLWLTVVTPEDSMSSFHS